MLAPQRPSNSTPAARRTPGEWCWWTSNSLRRLSSSRTGPDGDVAYASTHRHDRVPDIVISEPDMAFIAGATSSEHGLAALARDNQALAAEVERMRKELAVQREIVTEKNDAISGFVDQIAEASCERDKLVEERDVAVARAVGAERDRAARKAKRYLDVGAQLCEAHQHWHMPDEGCVRCNPPPALTPEEQERLDGWFAKLPVRKATDRERAAVDRDRCGTGPTSSTGVINALIARMKETAERYAKNPQPLRDRAHRLYDDDPDLADMLAGAANAIDEARRAAARVASAERDRRALAELRDHRLQHPVAKAVAETYVVRRWEEAELSEGVAAFLLGVDRMAAREIRDRVLAAEAAPDVPPPPFDPLWRGHCNLWGEDPPRRVPVAVDQQGVAWWFLARDTDPGWFDTWPTSAIRSIVLEAALRDALTRAADLQARGDALAARLEEGMAIVQNLADQDVDGCHETLTAAGVAAGALHERVEEFVEARDAAIALTEGLERDVAKLNGEGVRAGIRARTAERERDEALALLAERDARLRPVEAAARAYQAAGHGAWGDSSATGDVVDAALATVAGDGKEGGEHG